MLQLTPEAFNWLATLYHEFSEFEQLSMAPQLAECGHIADALYDRDIDEYNGRVTETV
jgi:hypothetical protein